MKNLGIAWPHDFLNKNAFYFLLFKGGNHETMFKRNSALIVYWPRATFGQLDAALGAHIGVDRMSLIRHAVPEDARAVAEIHVDGWRTAYSAILPEAFLASLTVASRQAFWMQFLADKQGDLLVAMKGDRMVGWINTGPCRDVGAASDDAEVWAFYVSPAAWSKGVGRELWLSARAHLLKQGYRQCHLWVMAQNARAIGFYKAAGFEWDKSPAKTFELGGVTVIELRFSCLLAV